MTTLIELARHAGLPVRMATIGNLVRNDSHDYVLSESIQTSEIEAAEMLIDYIADCLSDGAPVDGSTLSVIQYAAFIIKWAKKNANFSKDYLRCPDLPAENTVDARHD
jgi:hypothetical protein